MDTSTTTRHAITEHVAAFNSHDTARLLRGLHPEIVWATGKDIANGRSATAELFDDWLWDMDPHLDIVRLVVDDDAAAAQCVEHLTIDGNRTETPIGVFITLRNHLLANVKVFREGSAEPRDTQTANHEPTPARRHLSYGASGISEMPGASSRTRSVMGSPN